jgi:hypothetical protein
MEDMLKELKGVEKNELMFNCIDFAQKLMNVMLCFGGNAMCTKLKGNLQGVFFKLFINVFSYGIPKSHCIMLRQFVAIFSCLRSYSYIVIQLRVSAHLQLITSCLM